MICQINYRASIYGWHEFLYLRLCKWLDQALQFIIARMQQASSDSSRNEQPAQVPEVPLIETLQKLHKDKYSKRRTQKILLKSRIARQMSKQEFIAKVQQLLQGIDITPIKTYLQSYSEKLLQITDESFYKSALCMFKFQLLRFEKQPNQLYFSGENSQDVSLPGVFQEKFRMCKAFDQSQTANEIENLADELEATEKDKKQDQFGLEILNQDLKQLQEEEQEAKRNILPSQNDSSSLSTPIDHAQLQKPEEKGQNERDNSLEKGVVHSLNQVESKPTSPGQKLAKLHAFNQDVFQRAVNRLVSIDVTSVFSEQLKEVKDLFERQIKSQNSYLIEKMMKFLQTIDFLRNIKDYFPPETQIQQKLHQLDIILNKDYTKYLSGQNALIQYSIQGSKSQLYQIWLQLQQNVKVDLARPRQHLSYEAISKHLLSCLKNIKLYYTPAFANDTQFGQSTTLELLINLNHISQDITISQFKRGSLRSYLYLVIVHQMTHMTIRKMSQLKIKDNQQSIQLASQEDTRYGQIANFIKRYKAQILSFMKQSDLKIQELGKKNILSQIITQKIERWVSLIKQSPQLARLLRDRWSQIYLIRKKLSELLKMHSFINDFDFEVLKSQAFNGLLIQIMQFQQKNGIEPKKLDKQQKGYFNFVLSLVSCLRRFKVRVPNNYKQVFDKAEQKIHHSNLKNIFFIHNVDAQEVFWIQANNLYQNLQKEQLLHVFQEYFLKRQSFEQLETMLNEAVNVFYHEEIATNTRKFLLSADNMLELYNKQTNRYQALQSLLCICLKQVSLILRAQQAYARALKHLRFSEIYLIAADLPIFYLCKILYADQTYDSGYFIENQLFPNLIVSQYIFEKDFDLLKKLNQEKAKLVGSLPKQQHSMKSRIKIQRSSNRGQPQDCTQLPTMCGWRKRQMLQLMTKSNHDL